MIDGRTKLIAHVGYPTESFKAPMIYNPWLESRGINAAVVPMGCKAEDYAAFFKLLFRLSNVIGAQGCRRVQRRPPRLRREAHRLHVRRRGICPRRTAQGTETQ